jgi:hypothetical protein
MIKELLSELKYELLKNIVLNTFLKAVVAYFIFDIIVSLMDFSYLFSVLFATIYFVIVFFKDIRQMNIKIFEEHNPEIKEMLTTAADNMDRQNIVVMELFRDVIANVKRMSSGTLIVPRIILIMIITIPILAVIDFEISPLRIDALSQDKLFGGLGDISGLSKLFKNSKLEGDLIEDDLLEDDIYGKKKVAILGDQELNLKMNNGFETDLTKPKEEDKEQAGFKDYPDEELPEINYDSATLREHIEESDIAQKYNEKIRKME